MFIGESTRGRRNLRRRISWRKSASLLNESLSSVAEIRRKNETRSEERPFIRILLKSTDETQTAEYSWTLFATLNLSVDNCSLTETFGRVCAGFFA